MAEEKALADRLNLEAKTAEGGQVREYGERRTKIEAELAALAGGDEEAVADLERDVGGEWQALRDRIAAMTELQPEYDALREDLARMDERFAQIERRVGGENRTEIEGIEEKVERLRALEEEIGGEYDALLAREEVFLRAQELARQEERCLREVDAASEEMSLLESEIAGLARQLAGMGSIEDEIESAESRKEYLTSRISACAERQETLREEIRRLAEHRAEILAAGPEGGSCPTCHQGLGDHYEQLLGDLADAAAAMQKTLADLEGGYARATADRESLGAALKDLYEQRTVSQRLKEQHALYSSRYEQSASVGERWRAEAEGHRAAMRTLGMEGVRPGGARRSQGADPCPFGEADIGRYPPGGRVQPPPRPPEGTAATHRRR
ncbi:hypothetical protein [Methanoculleus chikugoensis]|uniref:hypothetical protein n=1 Tax=Methanoculleus chikugoensis TaxID=118126 RepID=UPI000AF8950B|nr:hypothetical protein [Methanoculleus chikugoensis]